MGVVGVGLMAWLLNPRAWLTLALAALLGYHFYAVGAAEKRGYAAGNKAGAARVQAQYDAFKGEMITRTAKLLTEAYEVGATMKGRFDARSKELTNETARVARERDALAVRLQRRPERPASGTGGRADVPGHPGVAAPAGGCTGAELYRPDGLFLAGEAARAEVMRAGLRTCYADLDEARERLDAFNAKRSEN